jgi:protein-S-isoprenylcysteine O-methyltransferase Ste14
MMDRWFKAVYFAGILIEMLVRAPYERRRRQIPKIDQRVSAAERGLLGGLLLGMFVLPLVYSATPWLGFADYRLSPAARRRTGWLGTALLAAALWLFWRSHRDLGENWSPSLEIGAGQTLTTAGVYRRVRHPMYASQWLWSLAQMLLLPNWIAGWSSLATFLPLYLSRVPNEERMMLEQFGDAYRAYMERTGRVLPRLRG